MRTDQNPAPDFEGGIRLGMVPHFPTQPTHAGASYNQQGAPGRSTDGGHSQQAGSSGGGLAASLQLSSMQMPPPSPNTPLGYQHPLLAPPSPTPYGTGVYSQTPPVTPTGYPGPGSDPFPRAPTDQSMNYQQPWSPHPQAPFV